MNKGAKATIMNLCKAKHFCVALGPRFLTARNCDSKARASAP